MCTLDRFCCCLPLRFGAFIVSILYSALAINGFLQYYGMYTKSTRDMERANLVFALINMVASITLFLGVLSEKRWLIKPWVLIMAVIQLLYLIVISVYVQEVFEKDSASGYTHLFMMFLQFLLPLYCLLVVCSYSGTLK